MTAITIARPTIVRTSPPPPAPAWAAASPPSPPRSSGVRSPFAAAEREGTSSAPRSASTQAERSAGIRITEGDPGWGSPSLSAPDEAALARGAAMFEPQLVHDRAGEQDDGQHVEPDQHDQHEQERRADAQRVDVGEVEREAVVHDRHRRRGPERSGPDAAPRDRSLRDAPVDQAQDAEQQQQPAG